MGQIHRMERLVRSTVLGSPFKLTNMLTKWDVAGRENLDLAMKQWSEGRGLVTISNHLTLFDDPIVLFELLGKRIFCNENKLWWSTPCQTNFSPTGGGIGPRFVRYFSDVSNMVFFTRSKRKGTSCAVPVSYADELSKRGGLELVERLSAKAESLGLDLETWLRRFLTPGDKEALTALNQSGMIEACARIDTGDWMHFFPEGGRSRTMHLRDPRRGVGKAIYSCPDAVVLPVCFYGMQDVLPIGATLPRPFKRVAVTVGRPLSGECFASLRDLPASDEAYSAAASLAWSAVQDLRPSTLARYMGPAQATALLRAEAPASHKAQGEAFGQPDMGQVSTQSISNRRRQVQRASN